MNINNAKIAIVVDPNDNNQLNQNESFEGGDQDLVQAEYHNFIT